jgi:hypothetical protein
MDADPDPLAVLRRWEESGGTWRVAAELPGRLDLELLTCDGGEVMGRLRAAPPTTELLEYVNHGGS